MNTEESMDDRRDEIMPEMSEISDISKDNTIDESIFIFVLGITYS